MAKLSMICLFGEKTEIEVNLPEGWDVDPLFLEIEEVLCPEHAIVEDWFHAQCPGCIQGRTDCDFFLGWYHNGIPLTEAAAILVRAGICPNRLNGTIGRVDDSEPKEIDLSEIAPTEAGEALVAAIEQFTRK